VLGVERTPRDLSSDPSPDEYLARLTKEPVLDGEVVEEEPAS